MIHKTCSRIHEVQYLLNQASKKTLMNPKVNVETIIKKDSRNTNSLPKINSKFALRTKHNLPPIVSLKARINNN